MKNRLYTRIMAIALAFAMAVTSFGCGQTDIEDRVSVDKSQDSDEDEDWDDEEDADDSDDDKSGKTGKTGSKNGSSDIAGDIARDNTKSDSKHDYGQPLYNLAEDYVFEFECSDKTANVYYDAFAVYDVPDITQDYVHNYADLEYDDGRILVSPGDVIKCQAEDVHSVQDGTWGDMSTLYLFQFLDLETGEVLEKPVITPFSIEHDLDAPVVNQGVNEDNTYELSWKAVSGASEYYVYEIIGDSTFIFECKTSGTAVNSEEFQSRKDLENLLDLLKKDMGADEDGYICMNSNLYLGNDYDSGKRFIVVASDGMNSSSGTSNVCDAREIASLLPYQIKENNIEVKIDSAKDIPRYVDVEMADASISKMLINYHGAMAYAFDEQNDKMLIKARVYNTIFDSFFITLTGVDYDVLKAAMPDFIDSQDSLNISGGAGKISFALPSAPSKRKDEGADQIVKDSITDIVEDIDDVPDYTDEAELDTDPQETEEGFTTYDLYIEATREVERRLADVDIDELIYADNALEKWLAYCLVANMETIPVPVCVFSEASNKNLLSKELCFAYRQNPTCGAIKTVDFSYEYESISITYEEDYDIRIDKTKKEISKAKNIAETITDSSMSDEEKIFAINNYLCENGKYDYDSADCNPSVITEAFLDAHTPYGILINNYGVCESYSEAFMLIARFAGLEVVADTGTIQGGGHEWNRVKCNGNWCIVDVTSNDNESIPNAFLNTSFTQSKYMLISDGYCQNNTNRCDEETRYEYFYSTGRAGSDYDEIADILVSQLENGNFAQARFLSDELMINADVESILRAACQKGKIENLTYYYIGNVISIVVK